MTFIFFREKIMDAFNEAEYGLEELASLESFSLKLGKFIGLITVEEKDKWVTISNINTQKFARDLLKYFSTSVIIKHMFKQVKSSSIVVHKFFLIDLEYILRALENQPKTFLGKRSYIKIREELKTNTWIGKLTAEHPSIFNRDKLKEINFKLLKHQAEFIDYYDKIIPRYGLKGLLLAADAGLGKTINSIAVACCYEAENVIVVCPKNAVFRVWEATLRDSMATQQTYWSFASGKPMPSPNNNRWFIFHYEALDKAVELANTIKDRKVAVLLDESHNLNDIKSLRTERFVNMCNSLPKAIIVELSGTPMKALGFEAIPLIKAIDPLFDDYCLEAFRKIYGKNAVKASEVLANRLGIIMYKVSRTETTVQQPQEHTVYVTVPNSERFLLSTIKEEMKRFITERMKHYELNKESYERTYWDSISYFENVYISKTTQTEDYKTYRSYIKEFIKFGYDPYTSGPKAVFCNKYEKEVIEPILKPEMRRAFRDAKSVVKYVNLKVRGECLGLVLSKARVECNKAIVEALDFSSVIDNAEKKTLVFTSYVEVVKQTENKLKELGYSPLSVYADTNSNLPQIVKKFDEDENTNPLIATYQSLSTAVPLIMANTLILLNAPFRIHEKEQTVSRANRLGQDKTVQVYNVFLDTKGEPNISTRSLDIMEWSKEQVNAIMGFRNDIDVGIESVVLECLEHDENTTVTLESYRKITDTEFETVCGVKWTKELKEHFKRVNPTSKMSSEHYWNLCNVSHAYDIWLEFESESDSDDNLDDFPSADNNKTLSVKFSKGWIPIAYSEGSVLYYDLSPNTNGNSGQLGILYDDDNQRKALFNSLKDLDINYNDGENVIKRVKEFEEKHNVVIPKDLLNWYTTEVMNDWYIVEHTALQPLPVHALSTTDFEIDGVLSVALFEYAETNYISYVIKGNEKYKTGQIIGVALSGDTLYDVASNTLKDFKAGKYKTPLHQLFTEERPYTSGDKSNRPWWKFWG